MPRAGWLSFFFCFKQKTAYEMRISDWSSDVCSSDLAGVVAPPGGATTPASGGGATTSTTTSAERVRRRRDRDEGKLVARLGRQIGSASCRERVCQYV